MIFFRLIIIIRYLHYRFQLKLWFLNYASNKYYINIKFLYTDSKIGEWAFEHYLGRILFKSSFTNDYLDFFISHYYEFVDRQVSKKSSTKKFTP
jgi:hypothetical protein